MTPRLRWLRIFMLGVLLFVVVVSTLHTHHSPGAAGSLPEIVGCALILILGSAFGTFMVREVQATRHARAVHREYRRLLQMEHERIDQP